MTTAGAPTTIAFGVISLLATTPTPTTLDPEPRACATESVCVGVHANRMRISTVVRQASFERSDLQPHAEALGGEDLLDRGVLVVIQRQTLRKQVK
jgi:hypothetical protein